MWFFFFLKLTMGDVATVTACARAACISELPDGRCLVQACAAIAVFSSKRPLAGLSPKRGAGALLYLRQEGRGNWHDEQDSFAYHCKRWGGYGRGQTNQLGFCADQRD